MTNLMRAMFPPPPPGVAPEDWSPKWGCLRSEVNAVRSRIAEEMWNRIPLKRRQELERELDEAFDKEFGQ